MLTQARVDFKKPDFKGLRKKGYTSVDMHVHTMYSDGINRVKTIFKKAKKLRIGVAITDHNDIRAVLRAPKDRDVMLIPGIETTTYEGIHTLFYFYGVRDTGEFYNKFVEPNKNRSIYLDIGINDILEKAQDFNAVISAAHPFAPHMVGLCKPFHRKYVTRKTINKVDAFEVITGGNLRKRNLMALEFAHKLKKNITGGSDAHSLREVGGVLTYTKEKSDSTDFLNSILKNRSFVVGKELMLFNKAILHTGTLRYPAKNPFPLIKRSLKYIKNRR